MFPNTGLNEGDVKKKVLLVCGEDVKDVLNAIKPLNIICGMIKEYREFHTFALDAGDVKMTLCVTGLGSASVETSLTELYFCGARCFVLTGTCGTLSSEFSINDVVLFNEAERHDGASFHYRPDGIAVKADPEFLAFSRSVLDRCKSEYKTGNVISTDTFYCMGATADKNGGIVYPGIPLKKEYSPPEKFILLKKMIEAKKPLLIDMETATFYSLCHFMRDRVFNIAIKGVANRVPFVPGEQAENTQSCLARAVLASYTVLKSVDAENFAYNLA